MISYCLYEIYVIYFLIISKVLQINAAAILNIYK